MDALLTPVSTAYNSSTGHELVETLTPAQATLRPELSPDISSPEQALELLRSEPSFDGLRKVLRFLRSTDTLQSSTFDITKPSPLSAQLINVLISDVIPNYWALLNEKSSSRPESSYVHASERNLLLDCTRSIAGLSAILARLKFYIQTVKVGKDKQEILNATNFLKTYLEVLSAVQQGDFVVEALWNHLPPDAAPMRRTMWHEVIVSLGGGKLLNVAAEASSLVAETASEVYTHPWVADGAQYCHWLTRNISYWLRNCAIQSDEVYKAIDLLLGKALRLGYPDAILEEVLNLVLGTDAERKHFSLLLNNMAKADQRFVVDGALRMLSKKFNPGAVLIDAPSWWKSDMDLVAASAGFLDHVIDSQEFCKNHLISWLSSSSGAGVGENIAIRRVVVATLSKVKYDIETVLEKILQQFGDQLYIKHAPILQQEVHSQVLLLSAGYVHRISPLKISMIVRSGLYLNAVSNRLAASSPRARLLGMVIGEALSGLAEKPDKQMDFKSEELNSDDARWYKSLTNVCDTIGPVEFLKVKASLTKAVKPNRTLKALSSKRVQSESKSKIVAIEEIDDSDTASEDDSLRPYAKPDSDAEDSDDDATLVQRNKPTAPVYIRDLITYLRDTENYDRQKLALNTAPSLIRRKTNFGTEVTAHTEELAKLLVGLQDKYDIENFQDMRLQGMIAVILSQPTIMAPWFARTFFDGDYSLSQRSTILTALGISARELGGYKDVDSALTTVKPTPSSTFPSKTLPPKAHRHFGAEQQHYNAVDALSTQLSDTMIQPIAASVMDKATGPNILKVRTFSSRLAVEAKRKPPTVNELSKIVAFSFFFPLTGRFSAHLKAYGVGNVVFAHYLLSSFLKTLALILHAAGPYTLQLQEMTNEFWDLLLAVTPQAQNERAVGQAVLFALMTILDINDDKRRLVEVHGRQLTETQRWVDAYFQSFLAGSEEDDKIKALAASVLVKIGEVVEKYQALLVGDLSPF